MAHLASHVVGLSTGSVVSETAAMHKFERESHSYTPAAQWSFVSSQHSVLTASVLAGKSRAEHAAVSMLICSARRPPLSSTLPSAWQYPQVRSQAEGCGHAPPGQKSTEHCSTPVVTREHRLSGAVSAQVSGPSGSTVVSPTPSLSSLHPCIFICFISSRTSPTDVLSRQVSERSSTMSAEWS